MGSEWTDGIWRSCGKMQTCDLHIWTATTTTKKMHSSFVLMTSAVLKEISIRSNQRPSAGVMEREQTLHVYQDGFYLQWRTEDDMWPICHLTPLPFSLFKWNLRGFFFFLKSILPFNLHSPKFACLQTSTLPAPSTPLSICWPSSISPCTSPPSPVCTESPVVRQHAFLFWFIMEIICWSRRWNPTQDVHIK